MPVSGEQNKKPMLLIKGAGDIASGAAAALHRAGFDVVMSELASPSAIRRAVCFSEAMYHGAAEVEGVVSRRAARLEIPAVLARGEIAVISAEDAQAMLAEDCFFVEVDAILAKRNTGTRISDAPLVIGLGPGFRAGADCHAVIETMRGPALGRIYKTGSASANTGVPGEIMGYGRERVMYTPRAGRFCGVRRIGDRVAAGETVAMVEGAPVRAAIAGVLRGILPDGFDAPAGMKCADVDPRGRPELCFRISDKAQLIGNAVLSLVREQIASNG